jgi:hypothetical protein
MDRIRTGTVGSEKFLFPLKEVTPGLKKLGGTLRPPNLKKFLSFLLLRSQFDNHAAMTILRPSFDLVQCPYIATLTWSIICMYVPTRTVCPRKNGPHVMVMVMVVVYSQTPMAVLLGKSVQISTSENSDRLSLSHISYAESIQLSKLRPRTHTLRLPISVLHRGMTKFVLRVP